VELTVGVTIGVTAGVEGGVCIGTGDISGLFSGIEPKGLVPWEVYITVRVAKASTNRLKVKTNNMNKIGSAILIVDCSFI
jgi:hypothetical protein